MKRSYYITAAAEYRAMLDRASYYRWSVKFSQGAFRDPLTGRHTLPRAVERAMRLTGARACLLEARQLRNRNCVTLETLPLIGRRKDGSLFQLPEAA